MQTDLELKEWSIGQAEHLNSLAHSAMINDQELRICMAIIRENDAYSMRLLRAWLYDRQPDPITNGNYNQTDLLKFIDKIK